MGFYLLIETRSILESSEVEDFLSLAGELAGKGHRVVLYLIQNAVLMAKSGPHVERLTRETNIMVRVDDLSIKQRSIRASEIIKGIEISGMTEFVELLTRENCRPVWHP